MVNKKEVFFKARKREDFYKNKKKEHFIKDKKREHFIKDKKRDDYIKTKCAICWNVLHPKSPLLHGTKCIKFDIRGKLKSLLPPQDFRLLFNENIVISPRICNMCFMTIRKIPGTVAKLEELVGKTINIKLYKPQRLEWNDNPAESSQAANGFKSVDKNSQQFPHTEPLLSETTKAPSVNGRKIGLDSQETNKVLEINEPLLSGGSDNKSGNESLCTGLQLSEDEVSHNSDFCMPSASTNGGDETVHNRLNSGLLNRNEILVNNNSFRENLISSSDSSFKELLAADNRKEEESELFNSSSRTKRLPIISHESNDQSECCLRKFRQCKNNQLSSENRNITKQKVIIKIKKHNNKNKETKRHLKAKSKTKNLQEADNQENKNKEGEDLTKLKLSSVQYKSKQTIVLQRTRRIKRSSTDAGFCDSDNITDISHSESKEEYIPTKTAKVKKCLLSLDEQSEVGLISEQAKKIGTGYKISSANTVMDSLVQHAPQRKSKLAHLEPINTSSPDNLDSAASSQQTNVFKIIKRHNNIQSYVPSHLTDDSKRKLLDLTKEEHESVHGSKLVPCGFPDCRKSFKTAQSMRIHFKSHTVKQLSLCTDPSPKKKFKNSKEVSKDKSRLLATSEKIHICDADKCDKTSCTKSKLNSHLSKHQKTGSLCCDACGKQFADQKGLLRHKRRIHGIGKPGRHRCPYEDCKESFVKKEKLEIHLCVHSPERRLFCEKCGKKFSCQRYLDVHYKIHLKNDKHAISPPPRTIKCEFSNCEKMFTTRENMKSHVLNQHRGRKPKAVPGVFFPCLVKGCEKKFSFRSTLYRHNKLVHKGGDYKLGREVVKFVCTYKECSKEFNRKNLLEEHMVMEHGKTPKRLLPLQNKELDFIERVCLHCGMVLTVAQLPRHEEVYHSEQAIDKMKENSPYSCHLKGCEQVFNTQEDRKSHVQDHIENPPYSCKVGECATTFFLEKNFDNHLWQHSKKVSFCDVEGCTLKFDDQLQLAKHSKIHYDGKMKCPWLNCDNWLTEIGHLKPHFIAHSRSLRTDLDSDFICEICELAFNSKWGLMIHKRMHGEEAAAKPTLARLAKFTCEEDGCQAMFADQKGFFDHFLFHYTNVPAGCDFKGCGDSFRNMVTLSRHTKCHYNGKFKCPWQECTKLFASVFIVKKHLYRHIISNPVIASSHQYSCNHCFMIFKLERNYVSHQNYHNEKSEYVCPTCGKKGRHNHLKPHRFANKPRKSQECQQCGAQYATISGLKFHLLQKHKIGKWPLKCDFCGKGFVSSREMQRHIPVHTKEKPFICEICGASFASHTGHRAHIRKHSGEKYICDVEGCGKTYTTSISLRGHKAQHAGFSKNCPFCGKTFKNPYGHKCKASREKNKIAKQGQSSSLIPQGSILAATVAYSILTQAQIQQSRTSSLIQPMIPAQNSMQHAMIIPQQLEARTLEVQQVTGAVVAPNTIPQAQMMPHSQDVTQGMSQDMLQSSLPHNLHNQGNMSDRGQPGALDITRGASSLEMTDYTFNNYVVFWDSQNVS